MMRQGAIARANVEVVMNSLRQIWVRMGRMAEATRRYILQGGATPFTNRIAIAKAHRSLSDPGLERLESGSAQSVGQQSDHNLRAAAERPDEGLINA
jgi:hypothetical protein